MLFWQFTVGRPGGGGVGEECTAPPPAHGPVSVPPRGGGRPANVTPRRHARREPGIARGRARGHGSKFMIEINRTIKYEADRVKGFGRELMKVPGCEQLEACIQCGTCSGVCPMSIYMDYSPRQVMALTRSDFKNVCRSETCGSSSRGCSHPRCTGSTSTDSRTRCASGFSYPRTSCSNASASSRGC